MSEFDTAPYEAEVKERWGDSDAYQESSRRTKLYSSEDWKTIKAQQEAIEAGLAEATVAGAPADGERATDLAEEARVHIDRWFYPCSHAMHSSLADMYTADERFKANYEMRAEGLAEYVVAAIKANHAREGA
jgi:hypothetical protein